MKIGIIGNMNNAYFSLARYLRDEGYDCELLMLANEPEHFAPANDTFSNDYKTYCKNVSWGHPGLLLKEDPQLIKNELAPYDFLIGNGAVPAYVARVGRKLDIFIPYGSDIYALPFFPLIDPRYLFSFPAIRRYQRKGINESGYILFDRTNKAFERIIKRLKYPGKRIVSPVPMFYHRDYKNGWEAVKETQLLEDVRKVRRDTDFLLVQHTRQQWTLSFDHWSSKGNDLLIEGLSQFVKTHAGVNVKLILFEYGRNVQETKKLIKRLALQNYVYWVPTMARNELMYVLNMADLIVGELRYSWLTYGVVFEALFLAKPFMHKRIDEEFESDYPELYPMLHAHSAQSVCNGLERLTKENAAVREMGRKGREWFFSYCVERPISIIKKIIDEKTVTLHA